MSCMLVQRRLVRPCNGLVTSLSQVPLLIDDDGFKCTGCMKGYIAEQSTDHEARHSGFKFDFCPILLYIFGLIFLHEK